jgi:hypothetical protein
MTNIFNFKSIFNNKYILIVLIIFIIAIWYKSYLIYSYENNQKCILKDIKIKGIIVEKGGFNSYHWIKVNNIDDKIKVSISKTQYYKGFSEDYTYEIGDSIYKENNSKELTIKRDGNIAIHIIACDN